MSFEEKYRNGMENVQVTDFFRQETIALMKQAAKRKEVYTMKKRPIKIFAVAVVLILILSLSAFAISYLLSASEVAENLGESEIAVMFNENESNLQTVSNEEYTVSLLGIVSGELLSDNCDDVSEERSYAVLCVARTDGTPLKLINGSPLQMTPIVESLKPWDVWAMGMSASGMEKDGVLYYLFDYANLEAFRGKKVAIAVFEGSFPTAEIFTVDENGQTQYAESYNGFKGIFFLEMN